MYGSGGPFLLVTPGPHAMEELQSFPPLRGPAVELLVLNGWTSGRFDVARVLARLFPSRRRFVRQVIAEGVEPAQAFPFGPYLADKVTPRSRTEVAYVTPAGRSGMGTAMSRFAPDAEPVSGLAWLTAQDGMALLDVRLPPDLRVLAPTILRDAGGTAAARAVTPRAAAWHPAISGLVPRVRGRIPLPPGRNASPLQAHLMHGLRDRECQVRMEGGDRLVVERSTPGRYAPLSFVDDGEIRLRAEPDSMILFSDFSTQSGFLLCALLSLVSAAFAWFGTGV